MSGARDGARKGAKKGSKPGGKPAAKKGGAGRAGTGRAGAGTPPARKPPAGTPPPSTPPPSTPPPSAPPPSAPPARTPPAKRTPVRVAGETAPATDVEAVAPAAADPVVPPAAPETAPVPAPVPTPAPAHRRSLRERLADNARPRFRPVDVAVGALLLLLGFAAVVQVRSTQDDGVLASARQEDLVRILDDLDSRSERLRREVDALSAARERLTSGTDGGGAALAEARRRAQVLGVLAGTVPAIGPGISLEVTDPEDRVTAEILLDALQELRDAGAEAVQLEGGGGKGPSVRVVASTDLVDGDGGVEVDGTLLRAPYRYLVVGDASVLASALVIPGGVVDTVERAGGQALVERRERVEVSALRPIERPRYARPAPDQGSGGG